MRINLDLKCYLILVVEISIFRYVSIYFSKESMLKHMSCNLELFLIFSVLDAAVHRCSAQQVFLKNLQN